LLSTAQEQIDALEKPDLKAMASEAMKKKAEEIRTNIVASFKTKYRSLKSFTPKQKESVHAMIAKATEAKIKLFFKGAKLVRTDDGYRWEFVAGGDGHYQPEDTDETFENPYRDGGPVDYSDRLTKESKRKIGLRII